MQIKTNNDSKLDEQLVLCLIILVTFAFFASTV